MKILLCWPYYYPEANAAAVRGMAFARYLAEQGIDVSVISPLKKQFSSKESKHDNVWVNRYTTYDTIGESKGFLLSLLYIPLSLISLYKVIKEKKPDLIIASSPGIFLAAETLIISKILGKPFIFDIRDVWEFEELTHSGYIKNKLKKYIETICCIHSTLIFTVTPTLKKRIEEAKKISPEKIKLVYNGVDLENFSYDLSNEIIYDLIHLGTPKSYYDTYRLIEAISLVSEKIPTLKLMFIGVENRDVIELNQQLQKYNLSSKTFILPIIPHEKVPIELSKAKIGLGSLADDDLRKNHLHVKLFEYMAVGLPVAFLGPNESEIEKFIQEKKVGVFSSDIKEFSEKVILLLKNEVMRNKMAENSKEAVSLFDRKTIVIEAYNKYINPLLMDYNKTEKF